METSSAPQSWSAMTLLHEGSGIDLEEDGDDGRQQKGGKKKRLSIQQVRSLEVCFEAENKLEPERKLQISQELGLEPRQVAIWFQNRRARWKTKQLEKDYELLKHNYDTLKSKFDAVHHDNKHLSAQVSLLKERLGDSRHDKMEVKSESREDSEVKWMEFGSEKQYESEGSSAILNEVCSYKMANNNNSVMKKNKESPNQNNSDGYMSGSMAPNLVTCDIHITHPSDESLCFTATDTDTATHDHHHTHHHHHHPPSHINFLQEDACNIVNVVDNPSAMAFQLWEWS